MIAYQFTFNTAKDKTSIKRFIDVVERSVGEAGGFVEGTVTTTDEKAKEQAK